MQLSRCFALLAVCLPVLAHANFSRTSYLSIDSTRYLPVGESIVQLLNLVQKASENLDYSGVYTWQSGNKVMSSRITHIVDGEGIKERVVVLDGLPREFVRLNQTQECLVPEKRRKIKRYVKQNQFPAILIEPVADLDKYYTMVRGETVSRVAGIECTEYQIRPRYKDRNIFNLCIEDAQKLLLKMQRLTVEGDLIEQVIFNTLVIGKEVPVTDLRSSYSTGDWEEVDEMPMPKPDLAGWRIKTPDGFNLVRTKVMAHGKQQLLFSDGITMFSIFLQKMQENEANLPHHNEQTMGRLNVYRERADQFWVTAVGTLPMSVLQKMATSAKYVPPVFLE